MTSISKKGLTGACVKVARQGGVAKFFHRW